MAKSVITFKITKEGIEFDIFESKPYFGFDERRIEVVSFDTNKQIPLPPKEKPYHYSGTWIYWIPQTNQWVGFYFSAGPFEEDLDGPYLILNESPPTEEEIAKATEKGKLVGKIIW